MCQTGCPHENRIGDCKHNDCWWEETAEIDQEVYDALERVAEGKIITEAEWTLR